MKDFREKPCKHCPFRSDVTPFLHPSRAEELAGEAENPYGSFPCHKTTEPDPINESEMMVVGHSQLCAGFLTLQASCNDENQYKEEGFKPSFEICYEDSWSMTEAYEEEWNKKRGKK